MTTHNDTTALHQAITKGQLAADVLYALGYHFEALHGKKPRWVAPKQSNIDEAVAALKNALKGDMQVTIKAEELDDLEKAQRQHNRNKIAELMAGRFFGVHTHLVPSWHKYRPNRREQFAGMRYKAVRAQLEGPQRHPSYNGPVVFFEVGNHFERETIWLPLECVYLT